MPQTGCRSAGSALTLPQSAAGTTQVYSHRLGAKPRTPGLRSAFGRWHSLLLHLHSTGCEINSRTTASALTHWVNSLHTQQPWQENNPSLVLGPSQQEAASWFGLGTNHMARAENQSARLGLLLAPGQAGHHEQRQKENQKPGCHMCQSCTLKWRKRETTWIPHSANASSGVKGFFKNGKRSQFNLQRPGTANVLSWARRGQTEEPKPRSLCPSQFENTRWNQGEISCCTLRWFKCSSLHVHLRAAACRR